MLLFTKGLLLLLVILTLASCASLERISVNNYCPAERDYNLSITEVRGRIMDWIAKINGEISEEFIDSTGTHILFKSGIDLDLIRYKSYFETNRKSRSVELTATLVPLSMNRTKVKVEVNVYSEKGSKEFASLGRYEKGLMNYIEFPRDSLTILVPGIEDLKAVSKEAITGKWLIMYFWESGWDGTDIIFMDNYMLEFSADGKVAMDYLQCQDGKSLTSVGAFEFSGTSFSWQIKNILYTAGVVGLNLIGIMEKERNTPSGEKKTDRGKIIGMRLNPDL